jgi:hypothetical protein
MLNRKDLVKYTRLYLESEILKLKEELSSLNGDRSKGKIYEKKYQHWTQDPRNRAKMLKRVKLMRWARKNAKGKQ